jgi:O-antigen ligase
MFGNQNGLGIFIVVAFGFYFALKETGYVMVNRWVKVLFFIVLLASLFWCSSRAALMAVIICYSFSFIYTFSSYLGWIAFAVVMFFYNEILNIIPLVTKFLGLARDLRADNVEEIKEGSGRIIAWQLAWWEIKKNMLLGEGLGFTNVLFMKYKDWLSIRGHQGHAHNAYLTFWLDTGLFGLLSYFIGLIVTVVKVSGRYKFITPILFSVLFSNYYESWLAASLNPFTPLFIITITVFYSAYNQSVKEEQVDEALEKTADKLIQVN